MIQKTGEATARQAYGKKLPKPITHSFKYMAFETLDEIRAAGKEMKDSDILDFWNNKAMLSARSESQTETFKKHNVVKPTLENSEELRLKSVVAALVVARGPDGELMYPNEDAARKQAAQMLGITLPTETPNTDETDEDDVETVTIQ
jgi:hypothetical protein